MTDTRIGETHFRLTVLERSGSDNGRLATYLCQCECGNKTIVPYSRLKAGRVKSCGCLDYEQKVTHGLAYKKSYNVWQKMMRRCNNEADKSFQDYGAKGVTVADEWHDVTAFYADMGECPDGCEIDRIDTTQGYSKANCRWIPRLDNARNKRNSKWWVVSGKRYESSYDAATELGVSQMTIVHWCDGWRNPKNGNWLPAKDGCYSELKYKEAA